MASSPTAAVPDAEQFSALNRILDAVHAATALLPPQGPITKFAFLNPLQGLEHRHYDEVMREVGGMYGNQAYLDDNRYREKLTRGRITEVELREVLGEDLGPRGAELVSGLTPRIELRLATLLYPLHFGQRRELDWVLAETEALRFFRPEVALETKRRLLEANRQWLLSDPPLEIDAELRAAINRFQVGHRRGSASSSDGAGPNDDDPRTDESERLYLSILWSTIRSGVETSVELASAELASAAGGEAPRQPVEIASATAREGREQDASRIDRLTRFRLTTSDPDVDELMIRFIAAYLDQGYAGTPLPAGEQGYWASFLVLYGRPALLAPRWRRSLARELGAIREAKLSPLEVIQSSLEQLGISAAEQQDYIAGALLSLRGFAGMIWQTESRPDLFRKPSPPGTLIEFLAVRLLLLRMARQRKDAPQLQNRAEVQNHPDRLRGVRDAEQQAFLLFELAQVLEWTPERLQGLRPPQWQSLLQELDEFCDHQRRRIFHAAFERCLAKMTLRAFSLRAAAPPIRPASPWLQVVCCLDAREESLRRNLEELDPAIETFGIAGFFGVPMYYRGVGDASYSAQCPIVMKPQHWVIEEPVYSLEESERSRARARRLIGNAQRRLRSQSRGSLGGAIVSTLLGPLATIPMLSRILLPRATAMMNRTARQFIAPPTITRLRLERAAGFAPAPFTASRDRKAAESTTGAEGHGAEPLTGDEGLGFTLDEMTQMSGKALRDMGLTQFAPLVILLGHGSGCLNNPHESAYHCGACAGNAGGPNARALAMMLNDARVRRQLATTGLAIPEETYFIGGQHNTATEEMMFFDLELLPTPKVKSVRAAGRLLGEAAKRNAHERCRRFQSADLDLSLDEALLHVQNRSEDLAQTRPEYGNGTNAISFVGRRSRIRGLFLDRRSFMMSYDPTQDTADSAILSRILAAVVPVCEGINLLYTLSAIDPIGWGAGTKLPHNVTSLIGVMDGAASDLRTGLPWQGVDIHEPVRLLFIIETTTDAILKIMAENATIDRIFRNHWAHLAVLDPQSAELQRFSKDRFVPYRLDSDTAAGEALPTAARSIDWYRSRRDHLPFAIITPDSTRAEQRPTYVPNGRAH